jgi:hypothetical protein
MPLAPKIDPTDPPTKVEKSDPDLAITIRFLNFDQWPRWVDCRGQRHLGILARWIFLDTMPLAPTINPTGPLIKVEKPDRDLAAIPEDQKAATDFDQWPRWVDCRGQRHLGILARWIFLDTNSCLLISEDIDMPLAPKIDPTDPPTKVEKSDPDLAADLEEINGPVGLIVGASGISVSSQDGSSLTPIAAF